ncbi:MAG: LuxR C-terminal-related transcriptional regulator [Gaiellaceae bacterium]
MSRSSPRNRSTSRGRSADGGQAGKARAADLLLLEELLAHLPVGILVNDAETLEILHANPPLPGFPDEHDGHYVASELASLVAEVAATGSPRHLPEFGRDGWGQGPRWWSASLHRIDTDSWGPVVVTLALDLTDQVRGRDLLEEREQRRLALSEAIAAVSGQNLVASLQQVADALVPALPVDVAALRLLDADRKLHLVAATGFRPDEIRRLTLEPLEELRMEAMIEGRPHPLVGSLGLRWVEIRWLRDRDDRIGTLTVGARSERRLTEDELVLLDDAAAHLTAGLLSIARDPRFLRRRSLEIARVSAEEDEPRKASVNGLRPRELAILRLYGEGLGTHQIAEMLVLSAHTVRTHVRNALRRLGVSSRHEALELLKGTDTDPVI